MKLDFNFWDEWEGELDFEQLCVKLFEKCPRLHTLTLHHALFSVSLPSVLNLCSKFLPNLIALILSMSAFSLDSKEKEYNFLPKIEYLDVSKCANVRISSLYSFSKMHYLKKLNLSGTRVTDNWFENEDNATFLHQLESLHLGNTSICDKTFRTLQNYAVNLVELFLCWTGLNDNDFSFSNSVFPVLKTICLRHSFVTHEGIVSLIQSCQSLENIYIDGDVAELYANHPFVSSNVSKLGIVKALNNCYRHEKLNF